MNIKTVKKQISKGEYELIQIDIDNHDEVEALRLHNREVNHQIYEEKKLFSRYSLDEIQELIGHEFADPNSDPFEKMLKERAEDIESQRNAKFEEGLDLLKDALLGLTEKQTIIVLAVIQEDKSFRDLSRELNIHFTTVEDHFNVGMKKLRKFFMDKPDFLKYFPRLNK